MSKRLKLVAILEAFYLAAMPATVKASEPMRQTNNEYKYLMHECLKWVPEISSVEKEGIVNGTYNEPIGPEASRCIMLLNNPEFRPKF